MSPQLSGADTGADAVSLVSTVSSTSTHASSPTSSSGAASQADPSAGELVPRNLSFGSAADGVPATSGAATAAQHMDSAPTTAAPESRPVTRLQRGITKPKIYTDGTVRWGMAGTIGAEEPSILEEALSDKMWVEAMNNEHSALINNKMWHLVPPPRGKNIIGCKWVYKVKRKANGSNDRYKACLVAKGYK